MADCQALDSSYSTFGAVRVEGSKVTKSGDGAAHSETVRKMFPEDLAEFVLHNPSSPELRPSATPPSATTDG